MPAWLRGFLEVLLAQLGIGLAAGVIGLLTGLLAAFAAGPDAMNLGPALAMLFGTLLGFVVAFVVLWIVAWRRWFRKRTTAGRFLLSWLGSLALLTLVQSLPGGGGYEVERVEGPPLVFWRTGPDGPFYALAPGPGEVRIDGTFVDTRCETLVEGEVCFLVIAGEVPEGARYELRSTSSAPVWWMPGAFGDVGERIETGRVVVRDAPAPRITALVWKVAEGRLLVTVESEAPLVVDALCFRFDGDLDVRTGAGGDVLRPGVYREFDGGGMLCVDPALGYGGPLPALVDGARTFHLPAIPGFDDPETSREIVEGIRKYGLAGGRTAVHAEVRLLGHRPGLYDYEPVRVQVDAAFELRPQLDRG